MVVLTSRVFGPIGPSWPPGGGEAEQAQTRCIDGNKPFTVNVYNLGCNNAFLHFYTDDDPAVVWTARAGPVCLSGFSTSSRAASLFASQ